MDQVANNVIVEGSWRDENDPIVFQFLSSQKVGKNRSKSAEKIIESLRDIFIGQVKFSETTSCRVNHL